jgi:uncharacterized phage protein (TIGR01671 family)
MREILFKGKRIDNGEWVVGQYVNTCYPGNGKETGNFIVVYPNEYHEIYTSTLCQFTGLCDKNGKKIWENDILMAHLDESYPEDAAYEAIQWGMAGWVTREAGSIDRRYLDKFDLEHYEVVGNIFDNPDLLQEESDE